MIGTLRERWLRFRESWQLQLKQSPTVDISSSSSSSMQQKHHVFLSFRGEDTRNNFTSHLHAALQRRGIGCFIDNQLKRGDKISPALLTAIEESMISIIILSKNYASSSWCLDELSKILECKEGNGQMIVPIFYHVDPSDVRKQTKDFAQAFVEHVKKRGDKVEKWRAALNAVGNLSGWHLHRQPNDRRESELIEDIVEDISKKLIYSHDFKGRLVGIEPRIEQIKSLLCFNLVDIRILGIWGMSGIGKTTIAEAIYHRISTEFEGRYILTNVREKSQKYGWIHLRDELLRNILEERNLNIGTSLLPTFIHHRLRHKRVFIVLDDVDNSMQLDLLFERDSFGPGSRIIVTSRDKQVLKNVVDEIYEIKGLNDDEALQLFSLYAFHQNSPKQDFMELSTKVVHYAKGVPLALKVVGSALYDRSNLDWEAYLNQLKKISDSKIDDVLRISYDGLNDDLKNIFLDIACFFRGNYRDYIENILEGCYYSSVMFGISVLIDKCLVTLSDNMLEVHDLLQEMGWNIVLRQSKEPGERSRLWTPNDIYHVLKYNTGTQTVEGMLLDMSKIRKVCLSPTVFGKMYNLKLLKFYYAELGRRERKVCISQRGLKFLPDSLRLLHWDNYPSKSLPSNFCPDNLVELCMPNSDIEKLWNKAQNLVKLKRLDLSGSSRLIEIPNLSTATNLESIELNGCKSLVEVPSSIECLSNLQYLNLKGCTRIERLPSKLCSKLKCLESLVLKCCLKLESFPEILETMECLEYLDLSRTSIEKLPSSIENLIGLQELNLNGCEKLKDLPRSIRMLESLLTLDLNHCSNLTEFPEIPGNLLELNLSETAIEQVPSSICLSQLQHLLLDNCTKLRSLPRNIFHLKSLTKLIVSGFSRLEVIQEPLKTVQVLTANGKTEIKSSWVNGSNELHVIGCSGGDELLDDMESLKSLCLSHCNLSAFPSHLNCTSSLTQLDLSKNSFETIPAFIKQFLKLKRLDLSYCDKLQSLPELPPSLEYLDARDCISLESVSSSVTICPMDCRLGRTSIFINCINLDQNSIWAKTQLSIQQLATEDVELYHKVHKIQHQETSFSIFFPGIEIPKWFGFQNEGSSVTIQLPQYLHDHKVLGFAVCVVLALNDDDEFNDFYRQFSVICQQTFKINGHDHDVRDDFSLYSGNLPFRFNGADHMFVNYHSYLCPCEYKEGHRHEVSFKFKLYDNSYRDLDVGMVKKCGVCVPYAQDDLTVFPYRPNEASTTAKRPRDDYCYDQAELRENLSSDEEENSRLKRLKSMEFCWWR